MFVRTLNTDLPLIQALKKAFNSMFSTLPKPTLCAADLTSLILCSSPPPSA